MTGRSPLGGGGVPSVCLSQSFPVPVPFSFPVIPMEEGVGHNIAPFPVPFPILVLIQVPFPIPFSVPFPFPVLFLFPVPFPIFYLKQDW